MKLTVNCDKPDVCEIEKEQIPESYFHEKKDPFDLMSFYMHFIVKGFYETSYFWRKKTSFVLCSISNLFMLKCNMLKILLCLFVLRLTWHKIASFLLLIRFRKK